MDTMTRRERLMATLRGHPVDRPAVSLYEIGGFAVDPCDADLFNVYSDPSWCPLLQLAEERTDLIRMRSAVLSWWIRRIRFVRRHPCSAWRISSSLR